jgi:DNA-binding NtrC family response regulator
MRDSMLIVSSDRNDISIAEAAAAEQSVETAVAHTYREALAATATKAVKLILCEPALRDGNWKDLLSRLALFAEPPLLVVVAEPVDQSLWAEAVSIGAYDVLAKPLDEGEARHVIVRALSAPWGRPAMQPGRQIV